MTARTRGSLHSTRRWVWMALALTACGGRATATTPDDAPGGDAPGMCSGPYPPDTNGSCLSKRALVVCQASAGGIDFCLSDTLKCGTGAECENICAPDEYAAWCSLHDGSVYPEGEDPFQMKGCHAPSYALHLSSAVYLCCKCPN
jgi:hypothetical protein